MIESLQELPRGGDDAPVVWGECESGATVFVWRLDGAAP
jgi:hypothetical protein